MGLVHFIEFITFAIIFSSLVVLSCFILIYDRCYLQTVQVIIILINSNNSRDFVHSNIQGDEKVTSDSTSKNCCLPHISISFYTSIKLTWSAVLKVKNKPTESFPLFIELKGCVAAFSEVVASHRNVLD